MYFELKDTMHIFEIKSWIPKNLPNQFRKGIAQLLDYEYQYKYEEEQFKNKDCVKHLLFHSDPSELFRNYWYGLMRELNISLCYIEDKKLIWHKEFRDCDPFFHN